MRRGWTDSTGARWWCRCKAERARERRTERNAAAAEESLAGLGPKKPSAKLALNGAAVAAFSGLLKHVTSTLPSAVASPPSLAPLTGTSGASGTSDDSSAAVEHLESGGGPQAASVPAAAPLAAQAPARRRRKGTNPQSSAVPVPVSG